jgi:phosphotriesterase-related protein
MTTIQTVLGAIAPDDLGVTSIHEHILNYVDHVAYVPLDSDEGREIGEQPVSLENLWYVRHNWTAVRDNLRITDEDVAVREVVRFAHAGGSTIVDPTVDGLGRDPAGLVRVSKATGVNVVMGAGYYIHPAHPDWIEGADEAAIAAQIEADVLEGVGDDMVKSGFIGEIGCSWPLTARERRSLRAAGRAQKATGVPLMIHPGRDPQAPFDIVRELENVGADISRTTIAHIDRTLPTPESAIELARTGVWLSFDIFGIETAFYPLEPRTRMLNDGSRLAFIEALTDAGFGDHVLIGQDICQKHRLTTYGGHGYDHILRNLRPMLEAVGRGEIMTAILEDNPRRFLSGSA